MTYEVWLFNAAAENVAILENAYDIQRTEKINQTPTLSFSLPADDAKASFLTSAYDAKIWNTIKSRFEGLYTLDDCTEKWDPSGSIIEANYSGVMIQLISEENITYDTTVTPKTPTQIITALLALQQHTPAITVGTIQPTTSFAFAIENANLLEAILKCVDYLGGWIEVDADRHLNWYNEPALTTPVREIRYKKNMRGVTRKRDFTNIVNKLYAYGDGETEAQVTLIDAGETYEYIKDVPSQTAYGIRIKRITDKRIIHPSTLLRWAQKVLAQFKDPVYYYTVDVVNLAEHPDFNFDFEELQIGQIIRVANSDLNNLNVNVKIVSVDTNLSKPENITVELANATKDLSDTFSDVKSYQNLIQNVAVQIGAGQVTVQGTFTVDGWRSAGVTTINGGQITAGTVTADKLYASYIQVTGAAADVNANVTTISGGKITANTIDCNRLTTSTINAKTITLGITGSNGVIQSVNYVADTSGFKIAGDGNAEFNSVKVRGTLYASTLETGNTLNVKGTIKSNNYSASTPYPGWLINGSGDVTFHDITITGQIVSVYETIHAVGTIDGNVVTAQYAHKLTDTILSGSVGNGSIYSPNGLMLCWKDLSGNVHDLY